MFLLRGFGQKTLSLEGDFLGELLVGFSLLERLFRLEQGVSSCYQRGAARKIAHTILALGERQLGSKRLDEMKYVFNLGLEFFT